MRLLLILALILSPVVQANDIMLETRYCGEPKRTASGKIARRMDVLREFAKIHPCPATGQPVPSCQGWAIDHVIPLACGGCDAVSNLQWLPNKLKNCAGECKDRWERDIYCKVTP